jgi:trigger factor
VQANNALQSRLGDKLAELVTDEIPDALIGAEMRARLDDMIHRLSHQGITLEQYLQFTGTEPAKFTEELRETATASTKVDLALRAIAVAEELAPTDEEFEEELERLAAGNDVDVDVLRDQLDRNDQLGPIRSDLGSRNALKWLTEHVNVVDESGLPVKREDLELPEIEDDAEDHEDHDHDHDHDGHDHDHEHD